MDTKAGVKVHKKTFLLWKGGGKERQKTTTLHLFHILVQYNEKCSETGYMLSVANTGQ